MPELGPAGLSDLPGAVVAADGEREAQHMVTGPGDHRLLLLLLTLLGLEVLHQRVPRGAGAAVEEALHQLEEAGFVLLVRGDGLPVAWPSSGPSPWLRLAPESSSASPGQRCKVGGWRLGTGEGARAQRGLPF